MKTFITADLHFGHANMMKFNPDTRQYRDADHMNAMLVQEWNTTVGVDDLTYILGDFAFLHASKASAIARMLNGRKILVTGNHDGKLLREPDFCSCFEDIQSYMRVVHNGTIVIMSHFPFLEWDQMHRGSVHFYGHVHGRKIGVEQFRCCDVGMDATGNVVSDMDYMVKNALTGEIKSHH